MSLDIAMGGSTNTVLHLLAAAHEAEVDFTMADIDRLSRKVPNLCKVAPSTQQYHMEDVHRAGGVIGILGELDRAGLLHRDVPTVHSRDHGRGRSTTGTSCAREGRRRRRRFTWPGPAACPPRWPSARTAAGRTWTWTGPAAASATSSTPIRKDGGLAVLYGNLAEDGCIVKTAGVDESILTFTGPARIFESQDAAVRGDSRRSRSRPATWSSSATKARKGGPGMQEMLYPTSYLKSKGLGKACALITDGRFSGGTSGLSIGHCSPEAAEGGTIGLVEEGDTIEIDIPHRRIGIAVSDEELAERRAAMDAKGEMAWQPENRERYVSQALLAYAALTTSAAKGAVRDLGQLQG